MELFNLLAGEQSIAVFGQTFDVALNWIGKCIRWLCNTAGVVGVGIILFSLVLKLITLPFDIYQRISMRKQNIQMKANQEKMEKLQKQYANDKQMYNQKVMEMYKANGISMFSSCLPMILSMIIFIVAINAFNTYAQYSNIENYNTMVNAYNAEMKKYTVQVDEENYGDVVFFSEPDENNTITITVRDTATEFAYIYYKAYMSVEEYPEYATMSDADVISFLNSYPDKEYFVDWEDAMENDVKAEYQSLTLNEYIAERKAEDATAEDSVIVRDYFEESAQKAVVDAYHDEVVDNASFGWIKNIWVTDASYKHPVMSASDFKTEAKREKFEVGGKKVKYRKISSYTNAYDKDSYNLITEKLDAEKDDANGYFVLIVLSIGTILLQQFVMQRSQKEQQKFSSVDGSTGSQQKITMVIMTGMFAIFSFMYSSAFSIYMITSNLFSLASMLIINKLVDVKMAKKESVAAVKRYENHAADRIEKAKNAGKESANKKKNK